MWPLSEVPQIGIPVAAPLMESLIYGQDDDIAACNYVGQGTMGRKKILVTFTIKMSKIIL